NPTQSSDMVLTYRDIPIMTGVVSIFTHWVVDGLQTADSTVISSEILTESILSRDLRIASSIFLNKLTTRQAMFPLCWFSTTSIFTSSKFLIKISNQRDGFVASYIFQPRTAGLFGIGCTRTNLKRFANNGS